MVRALFEAIKAALNLAGNATTRVAGPTYELAGVVCAAAAAATLWRPAGVWVVAAVTLLGKSLERDLGARGGGDE